MMFAAFYHLPPLLYFTLPDNFSASLLMYGWINAAGIPLILLSAGELMPLTAFGANPDNKWQWLAIELMWLGYVYISSKFLLYLVK